jgi:hypothetical protein
MAASFAGWLAATVRTEVVLCELEPTRTLTGFALVGGSYPTTYGVACPRQVLADVVPGGLYAPVIAVWEDATALAAAADLAAVEATAGSYWWDEANEVLYVHTAGGTDPADATLMQVGVRLHLANAPIVLEQTPGTPATAVYYLPWLTNELPRIQRRVEDLLSGSMVVPGGSVSFVNGHGAWFSLVAPDGVWNWKNKTVRFVIGGSYDGQALTRAQYQTVATMLVEDVAATELACTFSLQPRQRFAEIEVPVTPYFEDDYPNLGDGVRGTRKWIGYGRAIIPPDLTDTSSHGVYTIADSAFQTLFALHAVWAVEKSTGARTLLTEGVHYSKDLTACTVTVTSGTYAHANYSLAVDVTGKPDGAGSYLRTYGPIVADLLETFLGVDAADRDSAAFVTAAAEADAEIALWIKAPRSLASILTTSEPELGSLGRSVMGAVQQTVGGLWTVRIWNPHVDAITTSLRQADFARFAPTPKLKTTYSSVRVHYGYDHTRQQWSVVEVTDPVTQYRTASRDRLDIFTFLVAGASATTIAQRYLLLAGAVTVEAEFSERGARLAALEAGDKAFISYAPAPTVAGVYESAPFEILASELTLAPRLNVTGRLGNLRGLGGRVGRWMDSSAPDYSTATESERLASGFWCDTAGLADSGDPASAGRSLWW